eukprot:gene7498-8329_t
MGARKCCTRDKCSIALLVIGVILVVAGAVLIPEFPKIIRKLINDNIVIKNGSEAYDQWHNPTSPFYMNYYVFDLVNEKDVLAGKKPNVTQKGPYAYREIRRNDPVNWKDDGDLLTYLQYKAYVFDKEMSCADCLENDTVTTPNIPMLTLMHETLTSNQLIQFGVLTIFESAKVSFFHKLSVKEVLFGYNDTLLMFLRNLEHNKLFEDLYKLLKRFAPKLAAKIPTINPFLQLQYNGTASMNMTGTVTIHTGKKDINKIQETTSWKGEPMLSFWNSSYGNMINGSDGTHFKPNPSKTDRLYIFVTDICRSLYLNYAKEDSVHGIKLRKYTTLPSLFQNASVNEENRPFCVPKCYDAGLLPIGQCLPMNPPVFMSGPHFYQGAPRLVDAIIGMEPKESLHATFLNVEPYTGITMKAYKRLQVNVDIQSSSTYRAVTKQTRDMIYPVMYIEEHGTISDADAKKFKKQVYLPITIASVAQYSLIGLGGLLILSSIFVGFCGRRDRKLDGKDSEKSHLLGKEQKIENIYT